MSFLYNQRVEMYCCMMAELNKHVTQMIFDTCFTGQGGGD